MNLRRIYNRKFWYGFVAWMLVYLLGVFAGQTDWPWWSVFLIAVVSSMVFSEILDRRERLPK